MAKRTLLTEIYNSVPTIPYEGDDESIHTNECPLCDDITCPCWDTYSRELADKLARKHAQERNATLQTASGEWW